MKAIVLFIVLLLNSSIYAQTQETQLKTNDWYVYKVVVNNQEYLTPNNNELVSLGVNLGYSATDDAIWINLCGNSGLPNTYFINDNQFGAFQWVSLPLTNCM